MDKKVKKKTQSSNSGSNRSGSSWPARRSRWTIRHELKSIEQQLAAAEAELAKIKEAESTTAGWPSVWPALRSGNQSHGITCEGARRCQSCRRMVTLAMHAVVLASALSLLRLPGPGSGRRCRADDAMIELTLGRPADRGHAAGLERARRSICWAATAGSGSSLPSEATRFPADVGPVPQLFALGVSGRAAAGTGRRLRGERDGPLPGGPSPRPARQVGRAVRGSVSLVRALFFRPRLAASRRRRFRWWASCAAIGPSSPAMRVEAGSPVGSGVLGYYDLNRIASTSTTWARGRLGRLAAERGRADPRGHAPDGLQHGRPQPLLPAAEMAGRGAGNAVRSARRVRLRTTTRGGRPHEPGAAAAFRRRGAASSAGNAGLDRGLRRPFRHQSRRRPMPRPGR